MTCDSSSVCGGVCLTLIPLSLFFGLFFGLNYPEIRQFDFVPTTCTTLYTAILPRYCCRKDCDGCGAAPTGASRCSAAIQTFENINPTDCGDACPVNGSPCNNGYKCCATVCSTCRTCTTSSDHVTKCTSHVCNCHCVSSVSNQQCTVTCDQCYTSSIYLTYRGNTGEDRTYTHQTDFSTNRQGAENMNEKYHNGTSYACYYDPNNVDKLTLDAPSYTPWKWAITTLFGILPLLIILGFWLHYFEVADRLGRIRDRIRDRASSTPLEAVPIPVAEQITEAEAIVLPNPEMEAVLEKV